MSDEPPKKPNKRGGQKVKRKKELWELTEQGKHSPKTKSKSSPFEIPGVREPSATSSGSYPAVKASFGFPYNEVVGSPEGGLFEGTVVSSSVRSVPKRPSSAPGVVAPKTPPKAVPLANPVEGHRIWWLRLLLRLDLRLRYLWRFRRLCRLCPWFCRHLQVVHLKHPQRVLRWSLSWVCQGINLRISLLLHLSWLRVGRVGLRLGVRLLFRKLRNPRCLVIRWLRWSLIRLWRIQSFPKLESSRLLVLSYLLLVHHWDQQVALFPILHQELCVVQETRPSGWAWTCTVSWTLGQGLREGGKRRRPTHLQIGLRNPRITRQVCVPTLVILVINHWNEDETQLLNFVGSTRISTPISGLSLLLILTKGLWTPVRWLRTLTISYHCVGHWLPMEWLWFVSIPGCTIQLGPLLTLR